MYVSSQLVGRVNQMGLFRALENKAVSGIL